MINIIDFDSKITREVKRTVSVNGETKTVADTYFLTQFTADALSDISAMNADGSEYLNYPAGSAALCLEDGNVYVLNGADAEYVVPGGDE